MELEQRISKTLKILRRAYPDGGVLEIGNPFAMTVAVLLSARTKDEQVLKCLPALFKKYPTPEKMAKASSDDIAKLISSVGFYKTKAKQVKALASMLVKDFGGVIPDTIEEMIRLPGVGRKTASVVLSGAFHKQTIAVDTHVFRVVNRLGWVKAKSAPEMEKKLLAIVPEKQKSDVSHAMVPFGRAICVPNPRCWACPVAELCEYSKKNLAPPKDAEGIMDKMKAKEALLHERKEEVKKIFV